MLKKIIAAVSGLILLPVCAAQAATIGITLPTQNDARWYQEGLQLQDELQKQGHEVELYYGGDSDVTLQQRQLIRMIRDGVDVLVVASLNGTALEEPLKIAKERNIPVIAYDSFTTGNADVDYYITSSNIWSGDQLNQVLAERVDLARTELFAKN